MPTSPVLVVTTSPSSVHSAASCVPVFTGSSSTGSTLARCPLVVAGGAPASRPLLSRLCDELLLYILSFLGAEELVRASAVCRRFRRIALDESLWRALHVAQWGRTSCRPTASVPSWRSMFLKQRDLKHNWDTGQYTTTCLAGHTNRISAVQFNDNFILSASWDGTAILRHARTYGYVTSFSGHTDRVNAVQFNDDYVLTAGDDRVIILHTLAEGHIFRMYGSHGGAVTCMRWTGDVVVSGCTDRGVYLWDFHQGTLLHTLAEHKAPVLCVDASADVIASGSEDFAVKVYDRRGVCIRTLQGHTNAVSALQLMCDGAAASSSVAAPCAPVLLTGSWDGTVRLTDLRTPGCDAQSVVAHRGAVYALQQRGVRLVTGGSDGQVAVWDVRQLRRTLTFQAHSHAVDCLQFDEMKIVTGSRDAMLRVWRFDGRPSSARTSPTRS